MLKNEILKLRESGLSYLEISQQLNCSKSTVCYHLDKTQKSKAIRRNQQRRAKHPFIQKIERFSTLKTSINQSYKSIHEWRKLIQLKIEKFATMHKQREVYCKPSFTVEDVINKFGEKPKCYLTGDEIDIYDTKSYHFDHIQPRSRGGSNDIDNLGICTKQANQAKNNLTYDEFIELCKKVINNT